ncbi:MAG: hypothetical protein IT361_00120 [Gemmatimonadaceae bacterium]|nr:hypothetical protein [Gemmatimonadaceae bacterium]
MSINGVRGPYGTIPQRPAAPSSAGQAESARAKPLARPAPAGAPAGPQAAPSVSVAPPPGTDPELWTVLTPDERSYFAKLGAMGPLTYGRVLSGQMQPPQPSVRGGRLDVKA